MKVDTKYNIGQLIYFMDDNKVTSGKISKIEIDIFSIKSFDIPNDIGKAFDMYITFIVYKPSKNHAVRLSDTFSSKEDLLKSL